jgi:hypothetical protein
MKSQVNPKAEKVQKSVKIRWEHVLPTLCSCCNNPALYRIYVHTYDSKLGARVVHLCEAHFQELNSPVENDKEIITPTLIKISQISLGGAYKGYKSPLGDVIRDTDYGAISDDEWQEKRRVASGRKPSTTHTKVEVDLEHIADDIGTDFLDMLTA